MAGQTLSEIRARLSRAGIAPRKRFGQNFLVDLNLMRKLVDAAAVHSDDVVLEVGPGTGSLTEVLLDRGARVIAVEIDRALAGLLHEQHADNERFTLVQGDALAGKHQVNPLVLELLRRHAPGPSGARKLVANLPYQIATPLLMELLVGDPPLARMTCTIQREVGQRLSAAPGGSEYGPVSVVTQLFAETRLVAILPPGAFWPRPKVESVMLDVVPRARRDSAAQRRAFARFVQQGFGQRRKMLRRLVRDLAPERAARVFARAGVSADMRPQDLAPPAWEALFFAMRADPAHSP